MPPFITIPVDSPGRKKEQPSTEPTSSPDYHQIIVVKTKKKCFCFKC